ncbi:glycosyl hydrolase [Paenibacillus sp. GYB004]|uniref:glycosylhydrolase-like jelly roll fold domain-containing protein n=1 Tax=Paenibacillus sp. GYB004 TaxID=2994393 RepID=UPI002F96D248
MMADRDETVLERERRQFLRPDDEFSPMPFWFWNDALNDAEIVRQIRDFYSKGVAGFVIHPRLGLSESIPYLSEIYLGLVETAVVEADRLGMKVILYDEAMYPSGSAMGMVVRDDPAHASRGLRMIEQPCGSAGWRAAPLGDGETLLSVQAVRKTAKGSVDPDSAIVFEDELAAQAFRPQGGGEWTMLQFVETYSGGKIRGVYWGQDDGEPGAPAAADLLNPQATASFIRLTHEAYYAKLKRYFGNTVIAMFTDEPNILGRSHRSGLKPWTSGFLDYAGPFGFKEEQLPALWFEAGSGTERARAAYGKAVNARLAESFYRPLSVWCDEHGIQLTGHPGHSDEIGLLEAFQLPGQDIVWRYIEPGGESLTGAHSTLGKCSSDAARHRGRRRNLNECFGACFKDDIGWNFTADEMKWYMDWLFVRGVNLLAPHAFYYSIAEERKHERPPDVGPNSIWWPHYELFSTYMRRMSWLMTDSVNEAKVAILCEEDRLPWEPAVPLYENQIEFNYLEEELLVSSCEFRGGQALIADQSYAVIIVDRPERYREDTRERLRAFAQTGGIVVTIRDEASDERSGAGRGRIGELDNTADVSISELPEILDARRLRSVKLHPAASDIRVSVVRKGGLTFYLFVNEGESAYAGTAQLDTNGYVERWDAWEGTTSAQGVLEPDGSTLGLGGVRVPVTLERRASVIYCAAASRLPVRLGEEAGLVMPTAAPFPEQAPMQERTIRIDGGWDIRVELEGRDLEASVASAQGAATLQQVGARPEAAASEAGSVGSGGEVSISAPGSSPLVSWTEWSGMEHFSGAVVYESEFRLEPDDAGGKRVIRLDLGDVHEMAEVDVNGTFAGVRFWKPYRYADISGLVRPGVNTLRIRVTNSLANAYNRVSLPSGLLGPVTVSIG